MKSSMISITSMTLSRPILSLTTTVILSTVVFVALPAHGGNQHGKERSIQIITYRNQPAQIVGVKVKGTPKEPRRKFAGDSDWFNGLTVTVKNLSDKPIVFVTVSVMAPNEKDGMRTQVNGMDIYENIELMYGVPPPAPGEPRSASSDTPLMPNQTADLVIDERRRDEFHSRLRQQNSSVDIAELTLSVFQVAFYGDDNTMWKHGFWHRRDPTNPTSWLVIDDPPRLNHAAGKSKVRARRFPSFTRDPAVPALPEPLPRCTHRNIGEVPQNCTAFDIGGGLHCKWQNQVLLTKGAKNAIVLYQANKLCFGSDSQHACSSYETHPDSVSSSDCTWSMAIPGEDPFRQKPERRCLFLFDVT